MTELPQQGNGTRTFLSDDIDEARDIGSDLYYPHEVRVLGDEDKFQMRMTAASFGPVTLGRLDYSTEVEIFTNELLDSYQVNIPMRGELITGSGRSRTVANPHRAAVYRCDQRSLLRGWASPYPTPVLALKIDRRALEDQLAARLGIEVANPIVFDVDLDLDSVVGRQWLSLVEGLSHQLDSPEALALHPIVAAPMAECLMSGLLVAAEHDYRARLYEPKPALPGTVRLALDYLDAHAQQPLTVAQVAKNIGVSVRSLQVGFQNSLGTTPMRQLKIIRLQKARKDLLAADPAEVGVTEIAQRWGFLHVGRFAGDYRAAFGVSPSEDLRTIPFH
ncbi:AraC family transcriptional regulator [Rhodococcus sp. NCIMB 12038]|uniref:AraC family transcriptional regulator n=1 Tax=Rhodococcus sp. NCIMB 12038 TaxID=933800 RepID=UPI001C4FC3B1|nr:AraC family transcriptional regulator [Rhodococcus sp. NCIMB 12038]